MLVAFREGSHGWYFGRVVHERVTSPEGLRACVCSALILPCLTHLPLGSARIGLRTVLAGNARVYPEPMAFILSRHQGGASRPSAIG